jgi:hypothetical protein
MSGIAPLDRVTPLAVDPGGHVVMHGAVRTSVDGSVFDALLQWDGLAAGASRPGGLFDPIAGGMEVAWQDTGRHEYDLTWAGARGPACVAAAVSSPCLVPRLAELGHDRLQTGAQFASTLQGSVGLEVTAPPPVPLVTLRDVATAAVVVGVAALVMAFAVAVRRLARSPMGRVRAASREAMRATRGDATLQRLRAQVRELVGHASQFDAARRAFARKLRRIDHADLAKRTEACVRSRAPDAAEALAWLTEERAEAERLDADLAASIAGLERIESALRVVTMRAREHRGIRARAARADPVDAVTTEFELREEGLAEADACLFRAG